MSTKTQLAVIGAGPGGYAAAFLAADLGMEVTLIDMEKNPGGVCLYRGCIPSKALLHVAKLLNEAEEAKKWGIDFGKPKIDIDKLREFKDGVVGKLTGGLGQLSKQRKVNYIQGRASFVNSTALLVEKTDGSTEEVVFEKAILATGSVPASVPAFSIGSDKVMDSTAALELKDVPKRLLVVGGGYIGLELSTVYASLGSKVTVVEMMPGILPGADRDMVAVLERRLKSRFENIYVNTKVVELKETKKGIEVKLEGDKVDNPVQTFDKVLVSVGRKPVTKGLGLENTSVKINEKGFVSVDGTMKTDDDKIYAIGDIVGNPMLAHKAAAEGKVAVEAIMGKRVAFEPNAIPAVVFTDPELAWAGITETEAREKGIKYEVAKFPWGASGRATTLDRNDGMTKLIIEPETERIIGVGIVGVGAGDLIAEGTLAIEMGANANDLELTIHPHPTLSETMMFAAELYYGRATDMYRPKRK
ncbi:Pyruvate dehydrogenase E3 component [Melioribacter roseus P3M-2]|uniref:Dihydrolipoyl dehydrogenase n=1 Tax=Melioribacter roseus (strain DSM 23840 / JCM 17771 / VKM B-2668 / P3M-2) TaxID=1191523 RepID=I6ZYJ8_MELRP|nr:dihydrolipoyl dehydrogenase [Melioribacter roseus]AFN74098.1 Pyruvate dehydrogenase E3 component [Melioribacter roseus P3M-2]